jgi:ribosomal protein S10
VVTEGEIEVEAEVETADTVMVTVETVIVVVKGPVKLASVAQRVSMSRSPRAEVAVWVGLAARMV